MADCERCGQPHPGCTGHTKNGPREGLPCARPCKAGEVCNSHGGAAPQVRAARQHREQEAEAARQVATLGLPIDITPTDALLEEVRWTAGHVRWLREKVQELDDEDLVWGKTKVKQGGDDRGETQEAKPSIWYALYQAERKHHVAVCSAALRAGVEERKVRLAESQGDLVVAVIRRILDGLLAALLTAGLTEDRLTTAWTTAVADVVPRELRAIAGGA